MLLIVGKIRKIQRAKRDEMALFGDLFDNICKIAFDRRECSERYTTQHRTSDSTIDGLKIVNRGLF